MRILASADLHGHYEVYHWLMGVAEKFHTDAMVLAGDLFGWSHQYPTIEEGQQVEAEEILAILRPLKIPLFYIMGNDDFIEWRPSNSRIQYLQGKRIDLGSYNFVGYQYTPPFMGGIFERPEQDMTVDLMQLESLIDKRTVLVTHGPAQGVLDIGMLGLHAGSKSLWNLLERRPVCAHIHGHIHENFGRSDIHFNVASAGKKRCMIIDLSTMIHEVLLEEETEGNIKDSHLKPQSK